MLLETRSTNYKVTNPTADVVTASITEPVPQLTRPSGDGCYDIGSTNLAVGNGMVLVPFGAGSSTQAFTMAVYAWNPSSGAGSNLPIWVAIKLASFTCTLATPPGLAGTDVGSSELFCGTIALVLGNANVSNEVISPTGNTIAHIILDVKGAQVVEFRFAKGTATSANCLARTI